MTRMKPLDRTRIELYLEPEIAEILTTLAGGPRKRSQYVAALVRDAAQQRTLTARVEALAIEVERLRAEVAAQEATNGR